MAGRVAFEFATANRILFGKDKLAEAAPAVKALGRRALVVTGKSVERAQPLLDLLTDIECVTHAIPGEPKIADVQSGMDAAAGCEVVIAIGGGSGATKDASGADAVHTHMTNTRLTDPEVMEHRYPVKILECGIRHGDIIYLD